VNGRVVLVVEPESSGVDLVFAAADLGFAVKVLDRRPVPEMPPPVREAVTTGRVTYSRVETRATQLVLDTAVDLAARLEVAAVLPGFEYSVPTVALIAEKLGLPGLSCAAADGVRDKQKMKALLTAADVATAPAGSFDITETDHGVVEGIAEAVGFPAVIKPTNGCGSLGVRRLDSLGSLYAYLVWARDTRLNDMGGSIGGRLILESYIPGREVSIEGYVTAGVPSIVAITEKQLGREPHFVETGHVVEADLAPRERAALHSTAVKAVSAVGITCGVFHLEVRLSPVGPVVLEVAARLGGDRIHRLVRAVHGIDLPRVMVSILAGLPVPQLPAGRSKVPDTVAGVRFFTVDAPARINDPDRLRHDLMTGLDGVAELAVDAGPGQTLRPATDFRQRFGHVIATASDRSHLRKTLDAADELVTAATVEA
jgi:biotin carboxylase